MKTRRQKNVSEDRQSNTRRNTRSKSSENGRESSALPIPIDLIIEIFSRLPLKTIAICRCVSKLWASILRRPDFTELFLTKSSARPQLLFAREKDGELFFFSSAQPQNPDENSSPVVANFLMKFHIIGFGGISCGLHGLVCRKNVRFSEDSKERVVVICNPSTGQALPLPELKTRRVKVRTMFGYDPIDKQFKVLSMTPSRDERVYDEYQILTLGTGNRSWRMLECCIPHYDYPPEEICINGVLYYKSINKSTETYLIVCFDVRSEKFSFIQVKVTLRRALLHGILINYNGKLGLILSEDIIGYAGDFVVNFRSRSVKLWVLEEVGKQEWSDHIYLLPPLWKKIVGKAFLSFAGVTRTNEIVLSPAFRSYYPFYLFYLHIERNTLVRVEIQGMDASDYDRHYTFVDHVEDVKLYDV